MSTTRVKDRPKAGPPSNSAAARSTSNAAGPTLQGPASTGGVAQNEVARPELDGPRTSGALAGAEAITATVWVNGAVDAIWTMDQVRNGWIRIIGTGWRKVFAGSDNVYVTMMSFAAQSRATGKPLNCRIDDDQMIHEMYLW